MRTARFLFLITQGCLFLQGGCEPDFDGLLDASTEKRAARELYVRAVSEARGGALSGGRLEEPARRAGGVGRAPAGRQGRRRPGIRDARLA